MRKINIKVNSELLLFGALILHQPCYAVIEGIQRNRPAHDVTNFKFNLCSFFMGEGNGSIPRKPPQRDQKAAKNCSRHDCIFYSLPLECEAATTTLNAE